MANTGTQDKKETKVAKLVSVATATAPAFELEDGTVVNHDELLLRIYNMILKIEGAVA